MKRNKLLPIQAMQRLRDTYRLAFSTICVCASLFLVLSCEDIIDVDLRSVEPELVIEGVIRMDELAEVQLTKTKDFNSPNDYKPITDAQVTIKAGDGPAEELHPNEAGLYISTTIKGVQRSTYHLSVVYGDKEYTAVTYMPPVVELDSLTLFKFPMSDFYDPMVHFVDPKGEENQYYRFKIKINDEWPKLRERLMSTEFMDGSIIRQPIFVRYEEDHDDDDDPIVNGDRITVEMRCLDKASYTFFETLDNSGFSMANPTTNIVGGALGYFCAYSFTQKEIISEW